MPRGDRTGPNGMGPMTGRGLGYCTGSSTPGFTTPAPRIGAGFRRGAGGRGRSGFVGRGRAGGFARGAGQHGNRNMYYATGLPGWMRLGYSPGWGGLPPGAQYLQQTGQLNQARNWLGQQANTQMNQPAQTQQPVTPSTTQTPMTTQQPSKDQEIQMLENELQALGDQMEQIKERINQLRNQSE